MSKSIRLGVFVAAAALAASVFLPTAPACCPAMPSGKPVVNADQTVIIIWDAVNKTQHFIRKASFKSEADDFGFIIPSPTKPDLDESGNDAFPFLQKLTEPEVEKRPRPRATGCGCGDAARLAPADSKVAVQVLEEKLVAGFNAAVLEASSANALTGWLKDHGYAYSPEIEAWAKPYVEAGWIMTALKVAGKGEGPSAKTVNASSLRMSFKTDRPLFPYREPDPSKSAQALNASRRLLRIYFLADARYRGEMTADSPWTGRAAWANKISADDRKKTLAMLKLPANTGPAEWWLTEFEDNWPYRAAPADVYFARDPDQAIIKRPPIIQYVGIPLPDDGANYALAGIIIVPAIWRRVRRKSTE